MRERVREGVVSPPLMPRIFDNIDQSLLPAWPPQEEFREAMILVRRDGGSDNQTALCLKKKLAQGIGEA